ncbi:zinc-binding dehydrogenase [Burkholderia pyrrocinia]|uniref:zinc-binding dehydrogenase n=1 Tax=Burkholderia pyrrocinia TaxID=60550 RepID=UPI002AB035E1|nr:zinc-binding dehydrogenase [Burkholderia pyrrocinia]
MKASVAMGVGKGFSVMDVQIDEPIGREVLIEIRASGLCHTDLHFVEHDFGHRMPAVFGHEVAGVVVGVGKDVSSVSVGDHVVACLIQYCGMCAKCLTGRSFECLNPSVTVRRDHEPPRLSMDGAPVNQVAGIGGFAERALIHENQLAVVNKEVPFPQASVIGCAVVTGAGSAIHTAGVRVGDTVAVIGVGGVGLNAISGARLAGARRIIAIDIDDRKLGVARRFGATDVVNSGKENPAEAVKRITGGAGVDHSFEMIGREVTQALAVEIAGQGGHAYFVGLAKPGTTLTLNTSLEAIIAQKGVHGVLMGSTNPKIDIPLYADLYVQGRMELDELVTQEINIADINVAYEQLSAGGIVRSVITSF